MTNVRESFDLKTQFFQFFNIDITVGIEFYNPLASTKISEYATRLTIFEMFIVIWFDKNLYPIV